MNIENMKHCAHCAPEFTECWNDIARCRKRGVRNFGKWALSLRVGTPPNTLAPCPFCGSNDVKVILYNQPSVCCEQCGATGPSAQRLSVNSEVDNIGQAKQEARDLWDKRQPSKESALVESLCAAINSLEAAAHFMRAQADYATRVAAKLPVASSGLATHIFMLTRESHRLQGEVIGRFLDTIHQVTPETP